jgi:5-methylcytosine-specific restriction endonuclease McrA
MYAATRKKNINIRRARQLQASIGIPDQIADWEAILRIDPCAYCGGSMEHVDHISSLAFGGEHDWTNLTASCADCNMAKKEKPLLDFLLYYREQEHINAQSEERQ